VLEKSHRLPMDARLYFDGDQCLMDEVLDFDTFHESFPALCQRIGIPFDGTIPREKTGVRQEKSGSYQDYYDDETREKVANLFAREIKLMNYVF
jgi:hypothetical protein